MAQFYLSNPTNPSSMTQHVANQLMAAASLYQMSTLASTPNAKCLDDAVQNASINRAKRRNRTKFDKAQLDVLEAAFERTHYPDVVVVDRLAEIMNLTTERISVWFQNRRARFKRLHKNERIVEPNDLTESSSIHDFAHVNDENENQSSVFDQNEESITSIASDKTSQQSSANKKRTRVSLTDKENVSVSPISALKHLSQYYEMKGRNQHHYDDADNENADNDNDNNEARSNSSVFDQRKRISSSSTKLNDSANSSNQFSLNHQDGEETNQNDYRPGIASIAAAATAIQNGYYNNGSISFADAAFKAQQQPHPQLFNRPSLFPHLAAASYHNYHHHHHIQQHHQQKPHHHHHQMYINGSSLTQNSPTTPRIDAYFNGSTPMNADRVTSVDDQSTISNHAASHLASLPYYSPSMFAHFNHLSPYGHQHQFHHPHHTHNHQHQSQPHYFNQQRQQTPYMHTSASSVARNFLNSHRYEANCEPSNHSHHQVISPNQYQLPHAYYRQQQQQQQQPNNRLSYDYQNLLLNNKDNYYNYYYYNNYFASRNPNGSANKSIIMPSPVSSELTYSENESSESPRLKVEDPDESKSIVAVVKQESKEEQKPNEEEEEEEEKEEEEEEEEKDDEEGEENTKIREIINSTQSTNHENDSAVSSPDKAKQDVNEELMATYDSTSKLMSLRMATEQLNANYFGQQKSYQAAKDGASYYNEPVSSVSSVSCVVSPHPSNHSDSRNSSPESTKLTNPISQTSSSKSIRDAHSKSDETKHQQQQQLQCLGYYNSVAITNLPAGNDQISSQHRSFANLFQPYATVGSVNSPNYSYHSINHEEHD